MGAAGLIGPYFLRYSPADRARPWEAVGDDLDEAIAARERKQAYFEALDASAPVVQDNDDASRTKITDAVYEWSPSFRSFRIGGAAKARQNEGKSSQEF